MLTILLYLLLIVTINYSFVFIKSFSFGKETLKNKYNRNQYIIKMNTALSNNENTQLLDTLSKYYSFLGAADQSMYVANILQKSVDGTSKLIASSNQGARIEIAFPESRKNDISVAESLDINKEFVLKFVKLFLSKNSLLDPSNLYLIFPDKKEGSIALRDVDQSNLPCTITSIDTLLKSIQSSPSAAASLSAKTLLYVNPGFNVDEWLSIAAISDKTPSSNVIIVNGNLDRLRKNYYPSFFYPALAAATNRFFKQFSPALFLSPIAVNGDRLGAWLCCCAAAPTPLPWALLVRSSSPAGYAAARLSEAEPPPDQVWKAAKDRHFETWGRRF